MLEFVLCRVKLKDRMLIEVVESLAVFLRCCVIGGRSTGCSMVGLAEMVKVLVCCVWRRLVDIHDYGMSIPLSLFRILGWSRIWIASFIQRVYQCRSCTMHLSSLLFGRWYAS